MSEEVAVKLKDPFDIFKVERKAKSVRYSDEHKRVCMHEWASNGLTIKALSERSGVRWNTIDDWRQRKEPVDWEAYRIDIIKEKNRIAIQRLTEQFGDVLTTQLGDSRQLRALALSSIQGMIQEVRAANTEGRLPNITRHHILFLREFRACLDSVQKQQMTVFGVPERTETAFIPVRMSEDANISEIRDAIRDPLLRDALMHLAESLSVPETQTVNAD